MFQEWTFNHARIKHVMKPIIRSLDNWEERGLCLHSFRHFFITDTKASGLNPLFVEAIAGHSLRGIEATYTNFHAKDLQSIIEWQKELFKEIGSLIDK
jgi:integrase